MSAESSTLLHLTAGKAELVLAPHIGGSIVAYRDYRDGKTVNWMRPVSDDAVASGSVSDMASFPLIPWSGRLRDGTFMFNGQRITVPSAKPDSPHTIHGLTRYHPWQVVESSAHRACLRYEHSAGDWPFSFVAEQEFVLTERSLALTMRLHNTSNRPMPFGLGHHPYFPRNEHTTLTTSVGQAWFSDEAVMPLYIADHPVARHLPQGVRIDDYVLDNTFLNWSHQATINWPDQARALTLSAATPLDFLVLYSPADVDWFCVEPVSNTTDCFNLITEYARNEVGGGILEADEKTQAHMLFSTAYF
ncbi:MAG TPA: aldose 1-epimerase [Eoetvoesiella sp.]